MIAHNPLHGSGQAELPHPALTSGNNAHAAQGIRMTSTGGRQPAVDQAPHPVPEYMGVLAAPRKGAMPEPTDLEPKGTQRRAVGRHSVITDVSAHDRSQPPAHFRDGIMHAPFELDLDLAQLRLQPFAYRLSQHREPSIAPLLPADVRVSRPAEFHHQPLAEPSVRLSPHSAPIRQTCRSYGLSVARIEVLLFPVASVRSPRGFGRLGFSLNIRATGSCSSAQQPASASRHLYAGRRPLSHQAPCGLVPGGLYAPGFDDTYLLNDASSKGSLSFVSRMLTCTGLFPRFFSNAHTTALYHSSLDRFGICS